MHGSECSAKRIDLPAHRTFRGSGAEQRDDGGRYSLAVTVCVAAGGDDHCVDEIGPTASHGGLTPSRTAQPPPLRDNVHGHHT